MTNERFKITEIKVVEGAETKGNWLLLANFDCSLSGIDLPGCSLWLTSKGGFAVTPPDVNRKTSQGGIRFSDNSLRHSIMEKARAAYVALGGKFGEWNQFRCLNFDEIDDNNSSKITREILGSSSEDQRDAGQRGDEVNRIFAGEKSLAVSEIK